ncbi:RYR1 protein, partial [Columbina picui]|nr:RYR1 protein [Columbina picui]
AGSLQELISQTMVHWAQESFIQSPELVRAMFSLLHRQYDGLGELVRALPKAYTISARSVPDTVALLECLGQIRSLLIVQMGPEEETLMIQSIGCAPPQWAPCGPSGHARVTPCPQWASPGHPVSPKGTPCPHPHGVPAVSLLCPRGVPAVSPCPHGVPMVSPRCPRGVPMSPWCPHGVPTVSPWCPHGVPTVSPRCPHVPMSPQVVTYLASCGLQSCPMLLAKGYPDIGWNPCGGERYLDFLRFAVFVNGESVEENANVVVRLLIR